MAVTINDGKHLKITWKDPKDLTPYSNNSKYHSEGQIGTLANAIQEFKFDVPIVVDSDGIIIKGHGRREAAIRAGMSKVPVIVRSDLTPAQVRLARISDNKLGESPWDTDMLFSELQEIDKEEVDILLSGFNEDELTRILQDLEVEQQDQPSYEPEPIYATGAIHSQIPIQASPVQAPMPSEPYTPKVDPTIETPVYDDSDIQKKQQKLDKQFEQTQSHVVVACPYCNSEFYIDR